MRKLNRLLFDEPSARLVSILLKNLFKILTSLRKKLKLSILFIKQNAEAALCFADKEMILAQGRIMPVGNAGDLLNDLKVKGIYILKEMH
jgi:ABC-type branched-subunit amino acid transport system ATPase component